MARMDDVNNTFFAMFHRRFRQGAGRLAGRRVRTLIATLDGSGNLTVTDPDATGQSNSLTVRTSGSDLVITDANQQFQSVPVGGTLSSDKQTLTIPLSLVTGSLAMNMSAGDDSLSLDFSGGNVIPAGGLVCIGGGGNDQVVLDTTADALWNITGGQLGNVTSTFGA